MVLTDCNEDTASMAANALLNLIENNDTTPKLLEEFTWEQKVIDAAKPTATYAVELWRNYVIEIWRTLL